MVGVAAGNIGEAIADELMSYSGMLVHSPSQQDFDVLDYEQMRRWFLEHEVDTLILSHGYTHLDWFENQPVEEITKAIEVNLIGTAWAVHAFVNETIAMQCIKHIVIVGSMAYNHVLTASAPYCAAKAGLAHLVRCLGWELTPKGYRVVAVHPSNVQDTPMTRKTIEGIARYRSVTLADAEEYWGAVNLLPHWLGKSDIAELVRHLVTDVTTDFMSATNIELSAGQR